MTKKIIMALIIAKAITNTGFAQKISKTDSLVKKYRKNEVGFNIAPSVSFLLGNFPESPNFLISFKHMIKEKNALRFSLNYKPAAYQWFYGENYFIVSQSDSSQLRRYTERKKSGIFQINAGHEWRKGKGKLKYFFGTDFILGHSAMIKRIYDENYILIKYPNQALYPGIDTLSEYRADPKSVKTDIETITTTSFFIGTMTFVGFYCPITKRFSISVQTGFCFSFSSGITSTKNYISNKTSNMRISIFDFNADKLINDLSIVYRF